MKSKKVGLNVIIRDLIVLLIHYMKEAAYEHLISFRKVGGHFAI